ncbi:heterokaryon incompatibility protein-domain-containing protein [Rostrohypoxylon terebratum]|nr:heterokaryon incompatibility protein-domain-containing protein [Rostrohypoxylon terebratum]
MSEEELDGNVLRRRYGLKLCYYCNRILLRMESGLVASSKDLSYHPTQSSLQSALKSGCQFCIILADFNAANVNLFPSLYGEIPPICLYFSYRGPCIRFAGSSSPEIRAVPDNYLVYPGRETVSKASAYVKLSQDPHYTPGDATDSRAAWELCRFWIDDCINNHQRCKSLCAGAWWPTRLLYIGDQMNRDGDLRRLNIKLCLTVDGQPQGSYMTLSHCWGDPKKMLKLTNGNLQHLKDVGIPYADLPKTFQDFVRLCRFLHNDYVWIDSLCIIQDSIEDWTHESGTMADVYRYSKCNIAATSSQNPTEGCFFSRDPNLIAPLAFTMRTSKAGYNLPEKHRLVQTDTWQRNVELGPLNQRAWVVQERLLTPRQIHCSRQQLLWECRENFACETFPLAFDFGKEFDAVPTAVSLAGLIPTLSEMNRLKLSEIGESWFPEYHVSEASYDYVSVSSIPLELDKALIYLSRATPEVKFTHMRHNIYQHWINIIDKYSRCALSCRTDKLTAIAGIASRIQDVLRDVDDYVAGLWKSQLLWQLLWHRERPREKKAGFDLSRHLEPSYDIAPSWSWASFDGPVRFKSVDIRWKFKYIILMDILYVHDEHSITKRDVTSGLKESPLRLKGYLYEVTIRDSTIIEFQGYVNVDGKPTVQTCSHFCTLYMDYDSWKDTHLIPVLFDDHLCDPFWFLVIVPCPGRPGFYRRVGVLLGGSLFASELLGRPISYEQMTITLI